MKNFARSNWKAKLKLAGAALAGTGLLALAACGTTRDVPPAPLAAAGPTEVRIIAFNDFHGHLLPPKIAIPAPAEGGGRVRLPVGGAAWLADAIRRAKAEGPNTVVVSAGDMVGASPLTSALFLDEPTIEVMNSIGIDFNAVGNHEFDDGTAELLRLANGGCQKTGHQQPCRLSPDFPGAKFGFLAANSVKQDGSTLFPAVGIRTVGEGRNQVKLAFIGLTLQGTSKIVTPAGIAGIQFKPEAETVNALVPGLKAQGVKAIIVLMHEGGSTSSAPLEQCAGLRGAVVPIMDALDPEIDLVISGHTHQAYICERLVPGHKAPLMVTSAGQYGGMLTDIRLHIDPVSGDVVARSAKQVPIQSEAFTGKDGVVEPSDAYPKFKPDAEVSAIVARYAEASAPLVSRVVGRMSGPAQGNRAASGESVLGNLIADAQLAFTRAPDKGGAQIAFMNSGGVRADLMPAVDGSITYGQIFAAQPFGNTMVTRSFTGIQLKEILEQQFRGPRPHVMSVSDTLRYSYDLGRKAGDRVLDVKIDGKPLNPNANYRITMNNFMASGGDGFSAFGIGTGEVGGGLDVDALEAWVSSAKILNPPAANRIRKIGSAQN